MSDNECLTPLGNAESVFTRCERKRYRATCQRCDQGGYHGNRWEAHHVLPVMVFGQITDPFIHECLAATPFDINETYAMAGLPKLTAFILYFQRDKTMPFKRKQEKTVTMRRWRHVDQYTNQAHIPIEFPGDLPVHNPCNWGHLEYSDEVDKRLKKRIWDKLRQMKKQKNHPKPEGIRNMLLAEVRFFWGDWADIGNGPGGGGFSGVEANLRNRYGKAKDGWWKPLCMSRNVTSAPSSPSLRKDPP
jgi:hypothetical protein